MRPGLSALAAALTLCVRLVTPALAQGSRADYERAAQDNPAAQRLLASLRVEPRWLGGGAALWCQSVASDGSRRWVRVDVNSGQVADLFDAPALAEAFRARGVASPGGAPAIQRLEADETGAWAILAGSDKAWRITFSPLRVEAHPWPEAAPLLVGAAPPDPQGRSTELLFVNLGSQPVEAFWLNPGGGARSYGTIAPGEVKRQHTYSGHAWRFDRPDGSVVGRCEGAEDIAAIVLADAPLPGAQRRESEAPPEPQLGQPSQPPEVPRAVLRDGGLQIAPAGSADFSPVDLGLPGGYRASGPLLLSPNGRHALFLAARPAPEHIVTLVESSPPDQVQPRTLQFNYPKPGDEIDAVMPVLVDLASASRIPIDDALFPTPWSLDRFEWDNDGSGFTFLYNQRGHQVMRVLHVEAASGAARAIVDEACPTFFDYTNKTFLHRVHATGELIWMSERDGWNHLYLYDERAGRLKNQITSGDFVVRRVEWVDEARRQVWFSACGLDPSGEPYYIHFCRVNFDGSGFVVLTRDASGTHEVEFSPDKRSFIDSFSTTELPPQAVLRRADDGRPIAVLGAPSLDLFTRTGFTPPERFTAKGRDGATDICGLIFRPSNFDPAKTYPVIENIYAGPHDAHVPKSFTVRYGLTDLVELGFIVVRIDGMGTNWRSKSFHDVCWKNLVDAGLPDRIAWMKAAQDGVCPQMDLTRVGIYGGSAGGQNALAALLTHPEFYKAAAADCGCHDNRMDKIWWNEMWMGWPVGPHYARQSNVTLAPNLRGRLLLTVGELDQNVDPASTMQVVNALIKADKDFELIVVPGAGHGAGESPYAARRRQDFFVRALMGVEPRWE